MGYHSNSVNNEILKVYDIDKSIIPDIVDNIGNQGIYQMKYVKV